MKFFNILYECNDARDDILTSEAENASDGVFPHWFRADDHDNFDGDNYDDGVTLWFMKSMKQINTLIGKKGQQRMEQMAEIQKIVTQLAGWISARWSPINGVCRN